MFEYLEWYLSHFDIALIRWIQTDGNECQVRGQLRERRDTVVARSSKSINQRGGRIALSCRSVGEEMDYTFVGCREEVDYECEPVKVLARMQGKGDSLCDKLHLDSFLVYVQFDRMRFIDCHIYWATDCSFQRRMQTNC